MFPLDFSMYEAMELVFNQETDSSMYYDVSSIGCQTSLSLLY